MEHSSKELPPALSLLSSERPRNVSWFGAAGLLFGDWGTSRLYVLGIAFLVAGRSSFYLIAAMSLLILAVGWAYTQICRIYPDGGGVYTAAKSRSRLLAVVGALLLFADYTVTASLSAVEAFHYFGLGQHHAAVSATQDAGSEIKLERHEDAAALEPLLSLRSPGLWAIVSIGLIGGLNLLGPKHSAGFAIFAAIGMIAITLIVTAGGLFSIDWSRISERIPPIRETFSHDVGHLWIAFVSIVLALSGVEAIANLTGVMKKPVFATSRKSIWVVATEVAVFNLLLALMMLAIPILSRDAHKEDMMAFLAGIYLGPWGEWPVRIVGGALLLSATNTAVNGLMSVTYVMSRDGELPALFQKLNGFGAPWIGAIVAASVPAVVLVFAHDIETLASLYAIGVVGAVAINCCLCTLHPRLRKHWRKLAMGSLGVLLVGMWFTLAATKLPALLFVSTVLAIGLSLRALTRYAATRRRKPSLLRQAIMEQLTPDALAKPKLLLATAGSDQMADAALARARQDGAALVVCFVREVALDYRVQAQTRFTLDTDPAAQALFADFLSHGHRYGVPIIPVYDTGLNGAERVLIGTSRRGVLHHMIKGSFQRRLEHLLPPEIPVEVISIKPSTVADRKPAPEPASDHG